MRVSVPGGMRVSARRAQWCRASVGVGSWRGSARADQESSEHCVEGGGGADAAQQPQVDVLCGDDFGQRCQVRLWMVGEVGWSDPHAVAGAGVAVVAQ